jgi:hypothetical protein
MNIEIKEVKTRKELRRYINLPAAIHKDHSNWVPPIYMDDRVFFNPKKNEAFNYSDTILLLAYSGKKPVGRIMGIINYKYNDPNKLKEGRFCFLETYKDSEIAKELIRRVEKWAYEKGMDRLVGPLGFSDKDPQGLLVEGFDEPVVLASNCNFPYMVNFVEEAGFSKKIDLVAYKIPIPESIPEFYTKIHERAVRSNGHLKVKHFHSRREMKKYIRPVLYLVNDTFKDIYAFVPLSEKEMTDFANRFLILLDPRFIKLIENENKEVVAFVLGMADISKGIVKCKGRLLPFGIFMVFRAMRKTTQLNLLLGAIKQNYRNTGLDTMLGVSMLKEARTAGITVIDSHLELENNFKIRSEMEKMGGIVYKRFRIYQKSLVSLK